MSKNNRFVKQFIYPSIFIFLAFTIDVREKEKETEEEKVKWYSIQEALELHKENPKKIFIDIYTDWCGWCKKMDATTFSNPVIAEYLNTYFYPVKFNAESKESLTIGDKTFVNKGEGSRPTHEFAIALLNGQMSYPAFAFLDENLKPLISPLKGYQSAYNVEPILYYLGNEIYKEKKYPEFVNDYERRVKNN
ncbi:MAG: thioredoxin family protein [Bacteroidota bacterium]